MNWYKQANNDAFVYDMYDMIQEQYGNILAEYFAPSRQKGSQVSWSVIPASRINKIWRDYARTGVVRDEKGLMQIQEQMMSNLARLNACNTLAGHSQEDSGEIIEDQGFPPIDGKNIDFYFDFLDTQYGPPVSDFGLPQLWDLAFQLTPTMSAENRLLILDQFLNVVHQRGDLAALFIEGGAGSLTDLSADGKLGIRKIATISTDEFIVGLYIPGQIVSALGSELAKMQGDMSYTFHEILAQKEDLEAFLDSAERWQYGISRETLFWWNDPGKSVRRQVHEYLGSKGYSVKQENSYNGIVRNTTLPTILPDASGKNWYRQARTTYDFDRDKINGNFAYHIQMVLEGRKPAGDFDFKWAGEWNYVNYPMVLEAVPKIKQSRPDLSIVHYIYDSGGGEMEGYLIGKPASVQSIINGIQTLQKGEDNEAGHRMFGEGVGYDKEETDKYLAIPPDPLSEKTETDPNFKPYFRYEKV